MKNSNYGAFLPHKKSKRANLFVGAMAILLSSFMVCGTFLTPNPQTTAELTSEISQTAVVCDNSHPNDPVIYEGENGIQIKVRNTNGVLVGYPYFAMGGYDWYILGGNKQYSPFTPYYVNSIGDVDNYTLWNSMHFPLSLNSWSYTSGTLGDSIVSTQGVSCIKDYLNKGYENSTSSSASEAINTDEVLNDQICYHKGSISNKQISKMVNIPSLGSAQALVICDQSIQNSYWTAYGTECNLLQDTMNTLFNNNSTLVSLANNGTIITNSSIGNGTNYFFPLSLSLANSCIASGFPPSAASEYWLRDYKEKWNSVTEAYYVSTSGTISSKDCCMNSRANAQSGTRPCMIVDLTKL